MKISIRPIIVRNFLLFYALFTFNEISISFSTFFLSLRLLVSIRLNHFPNQIYLFIDRNSLYCVTNYHIRVDYRRCTCGQLVRFEQKCENTREQYYCNSRNPGYYFQKIFLYSIKKYQREARNMFDECVKLEKKK